MAYDSQKLLELMSRVYNNKMQETDGNDISEYVKRVFNSKENPDPSMLWQFNNLVVQQADEAAKPLVSDVVSMLANYQSKAPGTIVKYDIPKRGKVRFQWSANGSGVDLVRVENKASVLAVPKKFQTGIYYEPFGDDADAVKWFNELVDYIAQAKVDLYFKEISKLTNAAVSAGDIPAANVLTGDNLTLKQYNKVASTLARYGGRPVFVADTLLIDHFAQQQAGTEYKELLTDNVREELRRALNPTQIGRTDAINLINPFVDETNSATELPVNVGYMIAGVGKKPFYVTEFGGMKQMTEQNMEDERVKVKITQEADISLMFGETIAYIKENTAVSI